MTAHTRIRSLLIGAAAAALVAPLAVVAALANPASAAVGPRPHEVYMYKVEKQVDLSGEFPDNFLHEHLYCNPGDIALDGMWRVDHVDQANPQLDTYGDERDVVFYASYGDDVDRTEWHFRMENFADGNAQVKLFLTCIRGTVEAAHGHSHGIQISQRWDDNTHHAQPAGASSWNHATACPSGTYAVAPGFNFIGNEKNRIYRSWPTAPMTGWQWAFVVDNPNPNVDVYLRCINVKVASNGTGPHSHQIPMTWRPNGANGYLDHLNVVGQQERRINCDDGVNGSSYQDYKAMVGAFWIDDPFHVWYLGMDPRPKQRSYQFWWNGGGGDSVYMGALCIKSRTGKQIKP